jgi:hypothetical protein
MDWRITDTVNRSVSALPNLLHGEFIFTTIKCYNKLNMYNEVKSKAVQIVTDPPESGNATIHVYPYQYTVNKPTQSVQKNKDILQFSYHGFSDPTGISFFEFSISQNGSRDWKNAKILVRCTYE